MRETALIVEVPEAEPLVGGFRRRLDRNADLGIPAHITVLYPFVDPDTIDDTVLASLLATFAVLPSFGFTLDHTDWFGEEVLWLGPADDGPFRTLTRAAVTAFPDFPPYGGQFAESIPHLTVGELADPQPMRDAERQIRPGLPIDAAAASVSLMVQGHNGRWTCEHEFPLATATA